MLGLVFHTVKWEGKLGHSRSNPKLDILYGNKQTALFHLGFDFFNLLLIPCSLIISINWLLVKQMHLSDRFKKNCILKRTLKIQIKLLLLLILMAQMKSCLDLLLFQNHSINYLSLSLQLQFLIIIWLIGICLYGIDIELLSDVPGN